MKNVDQIIAFINNESEDSKIYIGCDSIAYKKKNKWYAKYINVVVVHKNGCNGCKIFGDVETEEIFIHDKKKPTLRLMNEVYKVSSLYLKLSPYVGNREIEVHLDLNPDEEHASSLVVSQAIGYIKGTCNVTPLIKPNAFAASYAADRLIRVQDITKANPILKGRSLRIYTKNESQQKKKAKKKKKS